MSGERGDPDLVEFGKRLGALTGFRVRDSLRAKIE
jgi:hypothetical protein